MGNRLTSTADVLEWSADDVADGRALDAEEHPDERSRVSQPQCSHRYGHAFADSRDSRGFPFRRAPYFSSRLTLLGAGTSTFCSLSTSFSSSRTSKGNPSFHLPNLRRRRSSRTRRTRGSVGGMKLEALLPCRGILPRGSPMPLPRGDACRLLLVRCMSHLLHLYCSPAACPLATSRQPCKHR